MAENSPPGSQEPPPPSVDNYEGCKPNFLTVRTNSFLDSKANLFISKAPDSCWSAIQSLEDSTKKFQRCLLEKLTLQELYVECEANLITSKLQNLKIENIKFSYFTKFLDF